VEFYSKNKFEKLVHLVGFYHDARSHERRVWFSVVVSTLGVTRTVDKKLMNLI